MCGRPKTRGLECRFRSSGSQYIMPLFRQQMVQLTCTSWNSVTEEAMSYTFACVLRTCHLLKILWPSERILAFTGKVGDEVEKLDAVLYSHCLVQFRRKVVTKVGAAQGCGWRWEREAESLLSLNWLKVIGWFVQVVIPDPTPSISFQKVLDWWWQLQSSLKLRVFSLKPTKVPIYL